MNFLVTFVQLFSSFITIISSIALYGIPQKLPEYGIEANQLQTPFVLALIIAILSIIFGHKLKRPNTKVNAIQIFGKKNKQTVNIDK